MTDLLRWGSPGFPDKQSLWAAATGGRWLGNGNRSTLLLGTAAAIGLTASAYLGVVHLRHERLAAAEQEAVIRAERANADLQDALARLRDQLGVADQALNSAQNRIASLSDEAKNRRNELVASEQAATSKADRVAQLNHALEQAQRELHLAEAQRVTLIARLSKAEAELAEGLARHSQAQAGLEQWQKKLQQLQLERDKAASERDHYRAQLEQKQSLERSRQAPAAVAMAQPQPAAPAPVTAAPSVAAAAPVATAPAPAPAVAATSAPRAPAAAAAPVVAAAAPAPAVVQPQAAPPAAVQPVATTAVANVGRGGLAQFERVLASTGVDVAHLFAQYGMRTGEGGPYIPAPRGAHPDTTLSPEKLAALARLVKVLPVSAPLQSYELGSPFGVRGDPINGHSSYHTGVDLRAPYMTPVYATAPGVVAYSGYRDDYGKVVEIDHGNGISTRYAHLHRQTVSVGQHIAAHTQIGFLGSTGRATGPHVHYEVLVNGEPQDPQKFIGLGHLVPVVAQR